MESSPSFSTHSEPQPISEDSGLLLTSGSFSSNSASGWPHNIHSEIQESDYDDKSLSLCESLEPTDLLYAQHFNTVKKSGAHKIIVTTIDPPPEFQDSPPSGTPIHPNVETLVKSSAEEKILLSVPDMRNVFPLYKKSESYGNSEWKQCLHQKFSRSPRIYHLSPCHINRPASRSSLSSRLSSSHNSLTTQLPTDDSTFITQAISHDTLSTSNDEFISDMYNVPYDSEFYAVPIDSIKPERHRFKKQFKLSRAFRNPTSPVNLVSSRPCHFPIPIKPIPLIQGSSTKRHSLPGPSFVNVSRSSNYDARQITLHEVRKYLNTLYSSSSESESRYQCRGSRHNKTPKNISRQSSNEILHTVLKGAVENNNNVKKSKNSFTVTPKVKKEKDYKKEEPSKKIINQPSRPKTSPVRILTFNLKQTFCNLFKLKRSSSMSDSDNMGKVPQAVVKRALPPLPKTPSNPGRKKNSEKHTDFTASIEKVKDYGWYWGPLSVEAAEKILSNEPDGSFIVRDSSDDHYIFSLTFKLNGMRHVRIEHEQGNFSFGGCTMFKASTIVEFIENAVETSRSGRYLFFLNLRPALGPVRVQLLHPVSRFKRVQSLQHMCRFVILKTVRRDLVNKLPLPRRLLDYLNVAHYYSELQLDS